MVYAPEYSREAINQVVQEYESAMRPLYERERARLMTQLGGRGTFYGTPWLEKGGALASGYLSDVGKFRTGLMTQGIEAGRTERLIGEQRTYEQPFKLAEYLGTLPGETGTYSPQTGWTWTGTPQQTLARKLSEARLKEADITAIKNALSFIFPILSAVPGLGSIVEDWKSKIGL